MVDGLLFVLAKLFGSFGTLMAPLSAIAVSVGYYRSSPPSQPLLFRLLASAHGLAVAFVWAVMLYWIQYPGPGLTAFHYLLLLPFGLIIASLFIFQGPRRVHLGELVAGTFLRSKPQRTSLAASCGMAKCGGPGVGCSRCPSVEPQRGHWVPPLCATSP